MDLSRFEVITFDCYGTLIDWETGILAAARPLLGPNGARATDDEIISLYAGAERQHEAGDYVPYRAVLRSVLGDLCYWFASAPSQDQANALADSLPTWPAFLDTAEALRSLKKRVKIGIISNVDDHLFAGTKSHLGIEPDFVITAERCRTYKPSRKNFAIALLEIERAGIPRERVLHAAESVYHDIEPAKAMGIATVWVNRRGAKGPGASGAGHGRADLEVPNVRTLAGMIERGTDCAMVRDDAGNVTARIERVRYKDGTLKQEVQYRGNKQHGLARYWHANGVLASESRFEDGLIGTQTAKTWNQKGTLIGEVSFVNGRQLGRLVVYRPDGKVRTREYFLDRGKASPAKYAAACLKRPELPRYPELEAEMTKARASAAESDGKDAERRKLMVVRAREVAAAPVTEDDGELTARMLESRVSEALEWLLGTSAGSMRNLGELSSEDSIEWVERLYEIGAPRVLAVQIEDLPGCDHQTANDVLVQLPREKRARKRLFKFESEHAESEGFDGETDRGQAYLYFKVC